MRQKHPMLNAADLSIPGREVDGTLAALADALCGGGDISGFHGCEGVAVKANIVFCRAYSADRFKAIVHFGGQWIETNLDIPESVISGRAVRIPLHPSEIQKQREIEEQRRKEAEALNPKPGGAIHRAKAALQERLRRIEWRRAHGY